MKTGYMNYSALAATAEHQRKLSNCNILTRKKMLQKVGLSNSTVHELRRLNLFPAPIQLSTRRVGWLDSEIESWIAARIEATRGVKA